MKLTIRFFVALSAMVLLTAAAPIKMYNINSFLRSDNIHKTFNVKPGGTLDIDLETGAELKIEGIESEEAEIEFIIGGRDADMIYASVEQQGNNIVIKSEFKRKRNNTSTDCTVIAKIPSKYNIDFETMGGQVSLTNIEGELEGKTMGGTLNLERLKGEIDIETMGGEISLTDSEVDGELSTMGGQITFENVKGNVDATTMGGNIYQRNVSGKPGAYDPMKVKTMGGSIEIDDAVNGAELETMGGSIEVNNVHEYLDATTMGGDIEIKNADARVKCSTMGGDVYLNVTASPDAENRDIKLSSMGGDIEVIVPEDFSMDIDVEITMDGRGNDYFKVISDFDLEEKKSNRSEWNDNGEIVLTARGIVNGGKNRVILSTRNGNVKIEKK